MRVLKPSGSIFVNLGDKYANDAKWGGATSGKHVKDLHGASGIGRTKLRTGLPPKSLMLLPERYRIGCVDELGLIARAVIIWNKPNGLPESVTDRVKRSHEDWVHLTKQPRYYSAVDAVREPYAPDSLRASKLGARAMNARNVSIPGGCTPHGAANPLGKLPGSVWTIATQPLKVPAELGIDHFAAFPMAWPRRIIQGWSPQGICTACGQGRRIVTEARRERNGAPVAGALFGPTGRFATATGRRHSEVTRRAVAGEACGCPEPSAPTRPSVVLDPFGGTGTTALVASALGRVGISVDYSGDYCRLAQWRTTDPKQRARAARDETKPPRPRANAPAAQAPSDPPDGQLAGQLDLFA